MGSKLHLASTRSNSKANQSKVRNLSLMALVRRAPADTKMSDTEQGALRIICSFRASEDDVADFFDGHGYNTYGLVAGSVKIKKDLETGRSRGECAVLFEDINEAQRACKAKQR